MVSITFILFYWMDTDPPISHNDMSQQPFSILTFDPIFTLIVNCIDPCPMSSVLFKEVWKGGQVHFVFCFLIWLMIAFCQNSHNLSQLILKLLFDLMLQQINGHWFKTHKSMSCPLLTIYVPKHPPPIYNKKYQKM